MTEFMSHIYDYILERGMLEYIDREAYQAARRKSARLSAKLYAMLTEPERELLEDWQAAHQEAERMETEAIFTAVLSLGKEFR